MPTLAPTFPELGRIRLGDQQPVKGKKDKFRPNRLDKFRLTSENKPRLDYAVSLGWGDEVTAWASPLGPQWQLYCTIEALTVVVPPEAAFSQYDEIWSGAECIYRCDGQHVLNADEEKLGVEPGEIIAGMPCVCDSFAERVPTVTRVSLFLPELPGIGVWRLDTRGFYAGGELQGIVHMLQAAAQRQQYIEADLAISSRKVRREGQTRMFPVPTLQPRNITMAHLIGGKPTAPALPMPSDDDVYLPAPAPKSEVEQAMQGNAYEEQKEQKRQKIRQLAEAYGVLDGLAPWCKQTFPKCASLHAMKMAELDLVLGHLETHQGEAFPVDGDETPMADEDAQGTLVDVHPTEAQERAEEPW